MVTTPLYSPVEGATLPEMEPESEDSETSSFVEEATTVVRGLHADIESCFSDEENRPSSLVVRIRVEQNGEPVFMQIEPDQRSDSTNSCLRNVINNATFPLPPGGRALILSPTLHFNTVSE